MANKYANLVGTNKIKDEYTKINTGFDKVEADIDKLETDVTAVNTRVDTIITTPISGQAATQEIVDARVSAVKSKTFASLDARFEETEQDIATHMADIAPHAETVKRTITVGVGKDFTTISAAIKSIKKRVDAIIRINVDAGVYDESVKIGGFAGGGALVITGGATLEDAKNYSLRSLYAVSNNLKITFSGFTSTLDTGVAFRMDYCYGFTISSCRAEKTDSANAGFYIVGGNCKASRCIASNRSTALLAVDGAIVFSNAWEAGTNNVRGIWCRSASTVGKYGTQPSGTTAEIADQGGAIR